MTDGPKLHQIRDVAAEVEALAYVESTDVFVGEEGPRVGHTVEIVLRGDRVPPAILNALFRHDCGIIRADEQGPDHRVVLAG